MWPRTIANADNGAPTWIAVPGALPPMGSRGSTLSRPLTASVVRLTLEDDVLDGLGRQARGARPGPHLFEVRRVDLEGPPLGVKIRSTMSGEPRRDEVVVDQR